MKILIAIDSFKGSMTSLEAGMAAKRGVLRAMPDAEVIVNAVADGGEGMLEALCLQAEYNMQRVRVTDPLGNRIWAEYAILEKDRVAVLEMAAAAGLPLVPADKRNPLETTTYGVGELIKDAIGKGCRKFIIGIGGSATNDGGAGMLQALGIDVLNREGKAVSFGAKGLKEVYQIKRGNMLPVLNECVFKVACDVQNPLCGPNGCSTVYGPQKGADHEMIVQMDKWMKKYAEIAAGVSEKANPFIPGTGAAGGIGFAFLSFLNASLEPGVKIVLDEMKLEEDMKNVNLVITGEGRLDNQSIMGKTPIGVAALAKNHGIDVVAVAGSIGENADICREHGIDAYFSIVNEICTLEEAMENEKAQKNMENAVEQIMRLYSLKI